MSTSSTAHDPYGSLALVASGPLGTTWFMSMLVLFFWSPCSALPLPSSFHYNACKVYSCRNPSSFFCSSSKNSSNLMSIFAFGINDHLLFAGTRSYYKIITTVTTAGAQRCEGRTFSLVFLNQWRFSKSPIESNMMQFNAYEAMAQKFLELYFMM